MNNTPYLSIVIPVYQAKECIAPLYKRLVHVLETMAVTYEIILVDDRSTDGSWEAVAACAKDPRVKAVRLSRNFGQHKTITAGLSLARGEWTLVSDCDLQEDPENLPAFYQKAKEGYDIVYSTLLKTDAPLWRRATSWLYHRFIQGLTGFEGEMSVSSFSMLSQKARAAFLTLNDAHRHYLILLRSVGFRSTTLPVVRRARAAGVSSYTFSKLVQHAVDGIIAQSNILLRWSIQIGFLSAFVALVFLVRVVYVKILNPGVPVGWSSLMAALLFMGGLILISLGLIGIYIDKIFTQVKGRPLFIIDETINVG
jgi:dolichol-phosphate mannosyltransferase